MRMHAHNIAQKTEVMVEHFRQSVRHGINGKAKAMVVTGSRLGAVREKRLLELLEFVLKFDDFRALAIIESGTCRLVSEPNPFWIAARSSQYCASVSDV